MDLEITFQMFSMHCLTFKHVLKGMGDKRSYENGFTDSGIFVDIPKSF